MKRIKKNALWSIVMLTIFYFSFTTQNNKVASETRTPIQKIKTDTVFVIKKSALNLDTIFEFIKSCKIEHGDILYAQIRLESGNLKSFLTKANNNLLGMKHPRQRPTTSLGEKNGYASYDSWKSCIYDYMIWQSRYAKKLSRDDYFQLLGRMYAEDGSYEKKLRQILQ